MKPVIVPGNFAFDAPSERDYPYEQYSEEFANGSAKRPYTKIVLWNQEQKPYCTRYSMRHIINGENINEYYDNGLEFKQTNPDDDVPKGSQIHSIQARFSDAKKRGEIEGWFVIKKDTNLVSNIRDALSKGMYISTGSNNGYWSRIGRTTIYEILPGRTDIGHAFTIVDDVPEKRQFKALNSRGSKWGDKGYFYIDYDMLPRLYTINAVKDKSNTDIFNRIKGRETAKETVRQLKKLSTYGEDNVWLKTNADYLRKTYSFTDDDL